MLKEYHNKYGNGHKMYFVWCYEKFVCVMKGHKNGYYIIMYNMEKHKMHTIWIVVRKMRSTYYILYWNGGLIADTTLLSWKMIEFGQLVICW